jgi:6,7-dimethyl-8-ribityllumazine synthase
MSGEPKVLIVAATFYRDIAETLIEGARKAIGDAGGEADLIEVPGAFEIPAAISFADQGAAPFDAYVALGCVIRGETTHYDYVCGESARGLQDLALNRGCAIGYGILTVENRDQAWARAAIERGNKGRDAAEAALAMWQIKQRFGVS